MNQQQLKRLSEILVSLTSKVKCPVCLSHIENSVQLECSHRFCEICFRNFRAIQELKESCPICKKPISKRAPIYKDQISDEFGKFTNRVCQLVKEKYAVGVEEICSKNTDIQQVIETSPGDELISKKNNYKHFADDAKQLHRKKLNFDANTKITSWLDFNQKKWDIQTQQHDTQADINIHEVDGFEMPSVSQVPPKTKEKIKKPRSRSLTVKDKESSKTPLKKYKSLNNDLDEEGNIEEVSSEVIVKQIELKMIQDMLEDECLANMEQLAQNPKSTPKRKSQSPETKNKKNLGNSFTSDGWDRIKDAKKSLKKREPKKLNIVLQDQENGNKKKSPKNNNNKKSPPKKIGNAGPSRKLSNTPPEIEIQEKEITLPKEPEPKNQVYDLGELESYFDRHIGNNEIPQNNSTSDKDNSDDYLLPTQPTPGAELKYTLHFVPKCIQNLTDMNNIVPSLQDELKSCLASATKIDDAIGPKLVDCFTNLLSYVEKLEPKKSVHKSTNTMTFDNLSVAVQCDQKAIVNVAVQTRVLDVGEKGTQTCEEKVEKAAAIGSPLSNKINISCSGILKKSKRKLNFDHKEDSSEIISATLSGPPRRSKKLQLSDTKKREYSSEIINTTLPTSSKKRNKKLQLSLDNLKENQVNIISSGSVLEFSLDSVKKSPQKSTKESQSRKFKRIRELSMSDSDSEDGNPSKRKFIKDDLSVEFVDSDKPDGDSEGIIPEKCDSVIRDIIAKYVPKTIPAFEVVPSKKPISKSQKSEFVFTGNDVFEENFYKLDKEISMMDKSVELVKEKTQEHIFTGHDVLVQNLEKLDKDLFKNEQISKTYDTELDLVENTPITDLKPRSNEKNLPLKILSKGAASNAHASNCIEDVELFDKVPSALNRKLPLETQKPSEDVAMLLEGLDEDDFLTNNMDCEENNDKNATFDDDIEDQLQKIHMTNSQKDAKVGEKRITILEDIRLRSPENIFEDDCVNISSTDDEDIVVDTPKKKKASLNCHSTEALLKDLDVNMEEDIIDVFIPPPQGFGDEAPEIETPAILDSPIKQKNDDFIQTRRRLPSVQGLTEFIVTPDDQAHQESDETQESVIFVGPMQSPKAATLGNTSRNKESMLPPPQPSLKEKRIGESEALFSPAVKSGRLTQPKYTPLVSTPRSSTKKPIIMTSTPNQKSILNFTSPSQKPKPCIMWSRIIGKDVNVFTQLEKKKLVTTSKVFSPSVTHLIVLVDEECRTSSHTIKILQAIAAGIWVVSYEWAEECLKMNKIVPEDPYEALDNSGEPGPTRARLARGSKTLFKGFKFYLATPLVTVNKKELEAVIELTGGEVAKDIGSMLANEEQFRVIVTESTSIKETQIEQFENWFDIYKAVTVDLLWFSSCLGQYKLISLRPFLVAGDENVIVNLNYPAPLLETVPYTLSVPT